MFTQTKRTLLRGRWVKTLHTSQRATTLLVTQRALLWRTPVSEQWLLDENNQQILDENNMAIAP